MPLEFEGRKSFDDWNKATKLNGRSCSILTPNRYDLDRFHLAVYNREKEETVPIDLNPALKKDDRLY